MAKKLADPNKLCMGCMKNLEYHGMVCPHCGFSCADYRQVKNSLPLYEILNGKYLVGKVIGVGGFGITYIGWDFYQGKKVCIKEYFPRGVAARFTEAEKALQGEGAVTYSVDVYTQNTEQARNAYIHGLETYIKEAETLSKFFFMPGIVSVRDFFYGNKTAYIVMEYIDGINLKQYAKKCGGRLQPDFLFPLLKDVLKALNEVHKTGIIHRDISPDNMMMTMDGKVKLIDFGAAKRYGNGQEAAVLLKHGYAPIEQYDKNGNQGPWTDIYSICASIYYLLTGIKIPRATEREQRDTVSLLQAQGVPIPEEQDFVIRKGMSIRQEDRYQNVADFYHALYGQEL
ncbi:MAG: serine/threonine protein kinase [Eubacterium sp.]|nr:serine/threonine protein kinase [Eubacterium sp.]